MSVFRVKKHQKNYVVINKVALENPNLSFKAKGLWAYCMSRHDDWEFHIAHLKTVSKEGEDAIYSAIKELISEGYAEKQQDNSKGKFGPVDYFIYEEPLKKCLPQTDYPVAGNPLAGNRGLLSNEEHQVNNLHLLGATEEEEEEVAKRIRERPKGAPRIVSLKKYKAEVLLDIRNGSEAKREASTTILKRRQMAERWDRKRFNGRDVVASGNYVELSLGSYLRQVRYDVPKSEWESLTGWNE